MKTYFKWITVAVLFITTVVFAVLNNEVVFPSALVGMLLVLTLGKVEKSKETPAGKAARQAIVIFSVLVILLNVSVSVFLPVVGASTDLSGFGVELTTGLGTTDAKEIANHFIAVTINDMHELCYSTGIFLLINGILLFIHRGKAL